MVGILSTEKSNLATSAKKQEKQTTMMSAIRITVAFFIHFLFDCCFVVSIFLTTFFLGMLRRRSFWLLFKKCAYIHDRPAERAPGDDSCLPLLVLHMPHVFSIISRPTAVFIFCPNISNSR